METALIGLAGVVVGGLLGALGQIWAENIRQNAVQLESTRQLRLRTYARAMALSGRLEFIVIQSDIKIDDGKTPAPEWNEKIRDELRGLIRELHEVSGICEVVGSPEAAYYMARLSGSAASLVNSASKPAHGDERGEFRIDEWNALRLHLNDLIARDLHVKKIVAREDGDSTRWARTKNRLAKLKSGSKKKVVPYTPSEDSPVVDEEQKPGEDPTKADRDGNQ